MTALPISIKTAYGFCAALLLLSCLLTLILGDIPWSMVWQGTLSRLDGTSTEWNPLLDERLPRLVVIICTGASLAVSGAVMQALFQNPLASPSVLGISIGGCLFVIPAFIMHWHVDTPFAVPLCSFVGCLFSLLIVYFLARNNGSVHMHRLIMAGIAISTLFLAIQGTILYALRDDWQLIQIITEWEAGSTTDRNWKHVHMQLPLTLVGLWGCWKYRREIDIISLGDEEASNLGVDVPKIRWRLFLCVALLTGGAIAAVGMIAFLGLILPHLIRKIQGHDHTRLIPFCMFGGSIILVLTDFILRFFEIHSLSIGNVSAIFGGAFFLILLISLKEEI